MTEPMKASQYMRSKKMASSRLFWSDTCLHLFTIGNAELMLEVWINSDATHFVTR